MRSVTIITTDGQLSQLRQDWERLARHPNADFEFYRLILKMRPEVLSPGVLALQEEGHCTAILAGRIEEAKESFALGYLPLGGLRVRRLSLVYGGNMGSIGADEARELVDAVLGLLRREKLDFATFSHLREGDCLVTAVRSNRRLMLRDRARASSMHYRLTIPKTMAEFLARIKNRRHFAKLQRVLEKDFPNEIEVRSFSKLEEIPQFARDAELIAASTYHRQIDAGFRNDKEHGERLKLAASKGLFRGYIMYVQGQPKAYWCGVIFADVLYLAYTGYDPKMRKYELGTLLFLHLLEKACGTQLRAVDFGFGDALYKQRFADENWREETVFLYAPTFRGAMINVLRTVAAVTNTWVKQVLGLLRVTHSLKTWWRKRLVHASSNVPDSEGASRRVEPKPEEK